MNRLLPRSLVPLLALLGTPLLASELSPELQPLQFLSGHCWIGQLDESKRDVQCFQAMYGGVMLQNTHMVLGSEPRYEGLTVYSWDGERKRIRFHYFTSTGAVSAGHAEADHSGLHFPELHVDKDGNTTLLDTTLQPLADDRYRVLSRQRRGEQWVELLRVDYQRLQAGGAGSSQLPLRHADRNWTLAWNRQTEQGWNAVFRARDGSLQAVSQGEGDFWLWGRSGQTLLQLCKLGPNDNGTGWRACTSLLGQARQRFSEQALGDGLITCRLDAGECLLGASVNGRKRLLRFDRDGNLLGPLYQGDWDDADPQFSSDGQKLLYRSNRSGSWELWLAKSDGSGPRQITDDPSNDQVPAHHYGGEGPARFAPSDEWIAWVRRFPDRGFDVWRMELNSGETRNLTADQPGDDGYPSISPDGHWIAFDSDRDSAGEGEIFVMPSAGGAAQRISWSPGADLAPLWIPLTEETK